MVLAVLAVLAAAVLFGTTGTAQALGPESATPLSVGSVRLLVGGTALALIAALAGWRRSASASAGTERPRRRLRMAEVGLALVTGVCLLAYQPLFFLGTERNGVAVGTVIALGAAPVLAGLLEWAVRRAAPRGTWLTATGLATAGVALLAVGGRQGVGGEGASALDPVGLLGSLGAGASFAIIAVAQRRLLDRGWHPLSAVGAMAGIAAFGAVFTVLSTDVSWLADPSGIAMALWLGLATITVAYALFTTGLSRLTAATAATLTLGEPLTASILGVVVLGEQLTALAVTGLLVLAAGLALLAWGSRAPRDPAPFAVEG